MRTSDGAYEQQWDQYCPITFGEAAQILQSLNLETSVVPPGLVMAISYVFDQLRSRVGEFTTIIVDEQSGHIPGIILGYLINRERQRQRFAPLPLKLWALGRYAHAKKWAGADQIREKLAQSPLEYQKALVLTEFSQTLGSIKRVNDVFRKMGFTEPAHAVLVEDSWPLGKELFAGDDIITGVRAGGRDIIKFMPQHALYHLGTRRQEGITLVRSSSEESEKFGGMRRDALKIAEAMDKLLRK